MRYARILLVMLALMLAAVVISACTKNTLETHPMITPMPAPAAVDLHKKGFDAYIEGNYSVALDLYNQSIAADPGFTRVWIDRGNVLVKMNRTSEAISSYDSALALENNLPLVWNSRGETLAAIGNYTAARDSFNKAIELAPEYIRAKENRDLILKQFP